ncbi:MAG TPA: hypothetical protein VEX37_15025 [Thermomicrobiales bacterium]|nr:hypothetical protein [Thermomicrobiales bacterium]
MSRTELLLERIGALSGIAFIGLFVAASTMVGGSDSPSPDDSSRAIATYMADRASDEGLVTAPGLGAVACLVVFISYLRHVLQRNEPSRTFLPSAAWAGGLLFAATLLALLSIQIASGVIASYGNDTQVAKTLYLLSWDFAAVFGPPLAVLIGATSLAGLLHGGLPRWLGWAGLPLVVVLLSPAMFYGFLLALLWLIALSIALTVRTIRLPEAGLVSRTA